MLMWRLLINTLTLLFLVDTSILLSVIIPNFGICFGNACRTYLGLCFWSPKPNRSLHRTEVIIFFQAKSLMGSDDQQAGSPHNVHRDMKRWMKTRQVIRKWSLFRRLLLRARETLVDTGLQLNRTIPKWSWGRTHWFDELILTCQEVPRGQKMLFGSTLFLFTKYDSGPHSCNNAWTGRAAPTWNCRSPHVSP